MHEIIGDYEAFIATTDALLAANNIALAEIVQCDTICYRVETNERYDELKHQLAQIALMISETEVNGRLIAVFAPQQPLYTERWPSISYIELPQPKPDSFYAEGIDHVQYVTRRELAYFHSVHSDVNFEEKGLVSKLNPFLKLQDEAVSLKLHDKHMGAVISLEQNAKG